MSRHRILMATDVPFWRNQTGAQQRMLHLVLGLSSDDFADRAFEIATIFIGVKSNDDEKLASESGLDVRFCSSNIAPDGIRKRIKWHMDGTIHLIRQTFRGRPDAKNIDQPMRLTDFHWDWAVDAFSNCVAEFQPDAILLQYVTMAYLLDGLSESQRKEIKCVVDTHDILSSRREQFEQFGYSHWIDIDRDEESKCLSSFDAALAITERERSLLQEMAPGTDVITASHSLAPVLERTRASLRQKGPKTRDGLLSIGYIGSSNHSNGHALVKFVRKVWLPLRAQSAEIRLVIAGGICDWMMFHEESRFSSDESMSLWIELSADPCVELMGKVDTVEHFYNEIDLAINPVEFGTGLKIKTSEAFAYGVPSIVTQHGSDSIPEAAAPAVFACESVAAMLPALFSLSLDHQRVVQLQKQARETAEVLFNNNVAFGRLVDWLHSE